MTLAALYNVTASKSLILEGYEYRCDSEKGSFADTIFTRLSIGIPFNLSPSSPPVPMPALE